MQFRRLLPLTEFCHVQNSVLRSPTLATLLHGTRAWGISQTLRRSAEGATDIRDNSAGRPSRWASAHILVFNEFDYNDTLRCLKSH